MAHFGAQIARKTGSFLKAGSFPRSMLPSWLNPINDGEPCVQPSNLLRKLLIESWLGLV